jgi:DNA-binding IclR family transcriptional regulator
VRGSTVTRSASRTSSDDLGDGRDNTATSVTRALDILTAISAATDGEIGFNALAREVGLARPTVHRMVKSLIAAGYVIQDERNNRYHLGVQAYLVGVVAARRHGIDNLAQRVLTSIADITADTAFLTLRRGNYGTVTHREHVHFPIRNVVASIGDTNPLGVGAANLAMLATLPDPEVEQVLDATESRVRERFPDLTREELLEGVAQTRSNGWSLNPGRTVPGSWAVGVAFTSPDGLTRALSIATTKDRLGPARRPELAELLKAGARELSTFEIPGPTGSASSD